MPETNVLFMIEAENDMDTFQHVIQKYIQQNPGTVFHIISHGHVADIKTCNKKPANAEELTLSDITIPKDTYVYCPEPDHEIIKTLKQKGLTAVNITKIIFCLNKDDPSDRDDMYVNSILAARQYLDANAISIRKAYAITLDAPYPQSFMDLYAKTRYNLMRTDFRSKADTSDFNKIRSNAGMTINDFAKYLNMPYDLAKRYDNTDECPKYLLELIRYKLTHENII